MNKPFDYIFIDTSVFQAESFFKKSGGVSRLFDLAEQGWVKILMPEIARREWQRHFKDRTYVKFEEVGKKATLMGNTKDANAFVEEHKCLVEKYDDLVQRVFDEQLKRAGVVIIATEYANDTLVKVFNKYFEQAKPFGEKGKEKEFPDAFILASLEKYAFENGIKEIQLFSKDDDMILYNNTLFAKQEAGEYLNDFILRRIPEYEHEEKRKHDEKDMAIFVQYLETRFQNYESQIKNHIENVLSDISLYFERFQYADIEYVSVKSLKLQGAEKNIEVLSIEEDYIQALFFVNVNARVNVNHFCEEESVWDSEEKKYIFEEYKDTLVELSSRIRVTFEMNRMELDVGLDPYVVIKEIDTDELQDKINDIPRTRFNHEYFKNLADCFRTLAIAQDMKETVDKATSINAALSKVTAMQTALQQMVTPENQECLGQIAAITPSLSDAIKSIQKM